jgi:hypothetical protein
MACDFEKRTGVHDELDDPSRRIDAPSISRHDGYELFLATIRVV